MTELITEAELLACLNRPAAAYQENYYAMYSSVFGGIVCNPNWMLIPVDDHVAHRGDGVFESVKCVDGALYNLHAHLDRLQASADTLELSLPCTRSEMVQRIDDTIRAGGHHDCSLRILVTRGPGSLGVNPGDCPEPQLYLIAAKLPLSFMVAHPDGAKAAVSSIPAKLPFFARVKSCNYLPNVLMAREANERKVDFMVTLDETGHVAECATENLAVVTNDGTLVAPPFKQILAGTTVIRVLTLAEQLLGEELQKIETRSLSLDELRHASEFLILGTTRDVTSVIEFEGQTIGDGKPGPVQAALGALLYDDVHNNASFRHVVFGAE